MKKHLFSFLLLAAFIISASAQKTERSLVERNLRKHVSYLASDQLEGRRTGEKGATYAAGYVSNMFARYKLKAGVFKTSKGGNPQAGFLQAFPYIGGIELGKDNLLEITDTRERSKIALKSEWAPLGFSPNAKIPFAPVVFTGFGISSQKLKYDDYKGLEVKDKIVLALDGVPDNENPHNFFFLFNAHAKAKIAKERGAKALILISRKKDFSKDKLALRFNQTLGETSLPTIVISRQLAAKILKTAEIGLVKEEEILNAKAKSEKIGSESLVSKDRALLANLNVNLIKKKVDAYNVIGVLEGKDPVLKNQVIVIGAHYDHLGRGGSGSLAVNSKEIHHGADDNASGTSAMLDLARQFSSNRNNKRTIVFIAFGGEEEGLLGSKFWVNNPTIPLGNIVAMINMDMVGRLKNRKLTVGGIGTANEWNPLVTILNLKGEIEHALLENGVCCINAKVENNRIVLVGATQRAKYADAIRIGQKAAKGRGIINHVTLADDALRKDAPKAAPRFALQLNQDGFGPSDHSSFYGKKIPVLFFFTGTHTDYHKPSDTAEKINYTGLEKITNFVSTLVRTIDRNPKRPTYTVAKSSGMSGARRGFSISLGTVPSYADGNNDGLVLEGVRDNSPASKAGIESGDKIVKLAGKEIRNISDYVFVLGEMKAGTEYDIVVLRGKEKLSLKIIPKKR